MRKILYYFLKQYFEALRADIDYCLMLEGEGSIEPKKTEGGKHA